MQSTCSWLLEKLQDAASVQSARHGLQVQPVQWPGPAPGSCCFRLGGTGDRPKSAGRTSPLKAVSVAWVATATA